MSGAATKEHRTQGKTHDSDDFPLVAAGNSSFHGSLFLFLLFLSLNNTKQQQVEQQ